MLNTSRISRRPNGVSSSNVSPWSCKVKVRTAFEPGMTVWVSHLMDTSATAAFAALMATQQIVLGFGLDS
jgi:hypothetical protein